MKPSFLWIHAPFFKCRLPTSQLFFYLSYSPEQTTAFVVGNPGQLVPCCCVGLSASLQVEAVILEFHPPCLWLFFTIILITYLRSSKLSFTSDKLKKVVTGGRGGDGGGQQPASHDQASIIPLKIWLHIKNITSERESRELMISVCGPEQKYWNIAT